MQILEGVLRNLVVSQRARGLQEQYSDTDEIRSLAVELKADRITGRRERRARFWVSEASADIRGQVDVRAQRVTRS